MINYILPGGGVTPANNLWKYVTASPDVIELNAAAGVEGIFAASPLAPLHQMLFGTFPGNPISGWQFDNGVKDLFCGIEEKGGVITAYLRYGQSPKLSTIGVDDNNTAFKEVTDGNAVNMEVDSITANVINVGDLTTTENIERTVAKDFHEVLSKFAGVTQVQLKQDINEVRVGNAGGKIFAILKNGSICTNQSIVGVRLAPTGRLLQLFDETNTSLGFVELITKV